MQFTILLASVAFLSLLMPLRMRWVLLLCASIIFYVSLDASHLGFLLGTCIVDFGVGRLLGTWARPWRKWLLGISLLWNLGVLGFFKYAVFFLGSLGTLANLSLPTNAFSSIIIPIGLSFYTFRSLSYVIDVYKGERQSEKHLGYYALYVSFFPTLLAGPIDRSSPMLEQWRNPSPIPPQHLAYGFRSMLFGGFLKYVVADNLSLFVGRVYDNVQAFTGPSLVVATYFFSMQIFCDFAGYSLIAIGAAKLLGIDVMENFRRPYLATSVSEFWNRWHISLSQWLRDYVYIPLGGSRASLPVTIRNVLITFLVSGLWHGANWTFVIWGLLHGLCISAERCFPLFRKKPRPTFSPVRKVVSIIFTFHLVTVMWIFFRAKSTSDALYVLGHLFTDWNNLDILRGTNVTVPIFVLCCTLSILTLALMALQEFFSGADLLQNWPRPLRWSLYYAVIFGLLFLQANTVQDFIYLQF